MNGRIQCHEALQRIYEYLDGELTPQTAEEVRRHIDICERCFPKARFTAEFRDAVQRAGRGQPPCPESLKRRILEILEAPT